MKLIPVDKICRSQYFYGGAIFRKYNVKRFDRINNFEEDYYDLLLCSFKWEDKMFLINYTNNSTNRGNFFGEIPLDENPGARTIMLGTLVDKFGEENLFLVDDGTFKFDLRYKKLD